VKVTLVGFGVVGRALACQLRDQHAAIAELVGGPVVLAGVCDTRGCVASERGLDVDGLLACKAAGQSVAALSGAGVAGRLFDPPGPGGDRRGGFGPSQFIASQRGSGASGDGSGGGPSGRVMVESGPSDLKNPGPAIENLLSAMRTGQHAVSVNKAPLAVAMAGLVEAAAYNRVQLRYSGTVGAGTPVLALARQAALGDRVLGVRAIINGTTNFILHRMATQGEAFDAALAEAVRLGYAEADPSNDIDGVDTAMKLVILANHLHDLRAGAVGAADSRKPPRPAYGDASVQGIGGLARERISEAAARGKVVKLIGSIDQAGSLRVAPTEVDAGGPMDTPRNVNAVCLTLERCGEVTLVGRGAGGPETATAIVRDLVDIARSAGG
jgi:homoserine dehydrogenase